MLRPKLTGDTIYIPVADGVFFRNNQGSLKLKGKVIYRWVERLAPHFDGQHTLEELIDGLDLERRALVTDLVSTLLANHFLKDTSGDLPHTLDATELERYAPEIAFIDSSCDSAASRFERWRTHHALVIGSGLPLRALVQACLRSGIRQLAVLATQDSTTDAYGYGNALDLLHTGDPGQTISEIATPDWENEAEVLTTLQPFDTILHISDQPMLTRARLLNRLCILHKKTFLQAMIVDDHAWIGPLVHPGSAGCWECSWRRLQANLTHMQERFSAYAFQDQTTVPLGRFLAPPTAALVANQLSFELFKYVTEAGPVETMESLIELDLATLRSQRHPFLPHPLCSACQQAVSRTETEFLDVLQQLEQGEPLDLDLFSRRISPCFGTRLGLFSSIDEDTFNQLPFSVCKAVVSNPIPQEHLSDPFTVLGIDESLITSRRKAALRACQIYASRMVDRRLLLSGELHQGQALPADQFLAEGPLEEVKQWTWASDLASGQAYLVPAILAYPVLGNRGDSELGVGSGLSWAEAVCRALLSLCQHLTRMRLSDAQQPYPQVDLGAAPLEPEGAHQRFMLTYLLERANEVFTIYDITGPLHVPTLAFCTGDRITTYTTQFTVTQALRDGLISAIVSWQLTDEERRIDALPAAPLLPGALRGSVVTIPQYAMPQSWPERQRWLLQMLRKQGWRALAVPLDHDPALRQVQPYIARVLLYVC